MIIVSDTSVISNLIQLGELSLLEMLYEEVVIPEKVLDELAKVSGHAEIVKDAAWLSVKSASDKGLTSRLQAQLDPGESEAIALAIELEADLLLIDEQRGRHIAKQQGILITGLLGILIEAKSRGIVEKVKPMLNRLILGIGFWVSPKLYQDVLRVVNEW